ncbi:integration host factor subunit beta [bacterium]|nr:integration host factor subunit beta [bacterium]
MTKADLVEKVADATGFTKTETAVICEKLIDTIKESIIAGERIELRRFGTFMLKERKSRMARNPRTGDPVKIPKRQIPVFKVSKLFKDMLD